MLTYAAVFGPLLAAWLTLHRAAGRRSCGYVGGLMVFREAVRELAIENREIVRTAARLAAGFGAARASAEKLGRRSRKPGSRSRASARRMYPATRG